MIEKFPQASVTSFTRALSKTSLFPNHMPQTELTTDCSLLIPSTWSLQLHLTSHNMPQMPPQNVHSTIHLISLLVFAYSLCFWIHGSSFQLVTFLFSKGVAISQSPLLDWKKKKLASTCNFISPMIRPLPLLSTQLSLGLDGSLILLTGNENMMKPITFLESSVFIWKMRTRQMRIPWILTHFLFFVLR